MDSQEPSPSRRRSSQFPSTTITGVSSDALGDWRWSLSTATTSAAGPSHRPSAQTDGVEDQGQTTQAHGSPLSGTESAQVPPEVLNKWPGCLRYYMMHVFDLIILSILGALSLGLWYVEPVPNRWFSPDDLSIAYPLRDPILNSWQAGLIAALVPLAVLTIMQCRLASAVDYHCAVLGLGYSLLQACTFQIIIKWLIGGLRPNFLALCDIENSHLDDLAAPSVYYRAKDVCLGDIKEAVQSFPSGHTTAAFAGFVFLSLYLNGKMKILANRRPQPLSVILTIMPLLGACLIAGALTIDKWHHWYDIVAGALIGTLSAFMSYRMTYASIWDSRFNHIPLSKRYGFTYRFEDPMVEGFRWARHNRPSIRFNWPDWRQKEDREQAKRRQAGRRKSQRNTRQDTESGRENILPDQRATT